MLSLMIKTYNAIQWWLRDEQINVPQKLDDYIWDSHLNMILLNNYVDNQVNLSCFLKLLLLDKNKTINQTTERM